MFRTRKDERSASNGVERGDIYNARHSRRSFSLSITSSSDFMPSQSTQSSPSAAIANGTYLTVPSREAQANQRRMCFTFRTADYPASPRSNPSPRRSSAGDRMLFKRKLISDQFFGSNASRRISPVSSTQQRVAAGAPQRVAAAAAAADAADVVEELMDAHKMLGCIPQLISDSGPDKEVVESSPITADGFSDTLPMNSEIDSNPSKFMQKLEFVASSCPARVGGRAQRLAAGIASIAPHLKRGPLFTGESQQPNAKNDPPTSSGIDQLEQRLAGLIGKGAAGKETWEENLNSAGNTSIVASDQTMEKTESHSDRVLRRLSNYDVRQKTATSVEDKIELAMGNTVSRVREKVQKLKEQFLASTSGAESATDEHAELQAMELMRTRTSKGRASVVIEAEKEEIERGR